MASLDNPSRVRTGHLPLELVREKRPAATNNGPTEIDATERRCHVMHDKIHVFPTPPQPAVCPDPDPRFSGARQMHADLMASAQIPAIAHLIANAHALYEGQPMPDPLTPEHRRVYSRAACLALRFVTEWARDGAMKRTQQLAVNTFDELKARLKSCDYTPEDVDEAISLWARGLVETFCHHLAVGCGRSTAEHEFYNQAMADFEAGFQPALNLPPYDGTTGE